MNMEDPENVTGLNASSSLTVYSIWEIGKLEMCMLISSFLSGLPLHSCVFWLIVRGTGGGVASEFFNLNLAICGAIFSVNSLFFLCIKWFPNHSLIMLSYFFFAFALEARPLFQCLMCVERYLAVVHPLTFLKYKHLRYRVICSVIAWPLILASCGAVTVFIFYLYVNLLYSLILAQLVLFLSIQIFCCVLVLRALNQSGPGERRRVRDEENHMKRKAFIIIFVTFVSLVITYAPFSIMIFLLLMGRLSNQTLWSSCYVFFTLAGFCMPSLFLQSSGKLPCLNYIAKKRFQTIFHFFK